MHNCYTHRSSELPGGPIGGLPSLSLTTKCSWMYLGEGCQASLTNTPRCIKRNKPVSSSITYQAVTAMSNAIQYKFSLTDSTAILQVKPGQPAPIEAKDDGSGGDSYSHRLRKAPAKPSPPTPRFYRLDALPVAQPTMLKH